MSFWKSFGLRCHYVSSGSILVAFTRLSIMLCGDTHALQWRRRCQLPASHNDTLECASSLVPDREEESWVRCEDRGGKKRWRHKETGRLWGRDTWVKKQEREHLREERKKEEDEGEEEESFVFIVCLLSESLELNLVVQGTISHLDVS